MRGYNKFMKCLKRVTLERSVYLCARVAMIRAALKGVLSIGPDAAFLGRASIAPNK